MALQLTVESFVAGVRQSGLVELKTLDNALASLERQGADLSSAQKVADRLIEAGLITPWQSAKLLNGKFRGFVLGRYRLQELLGRGEMSSVYLAEHIMMRRRCAIKVLPASKVKDTSYLGRFQREAQAVAALDHANIVRAYDVDMVQEAGTDIHFLAMEYVEGINLEKYVDREGEIDFREAAEIIRQAASGLAHAHEAGLIHRDIKPGNLLINTNGIVKILDMGLARFFKEEEEESLTIKHDEKVLGTADYLAPEQAVDSHAVDERADIYSLGCTFYFALTGSPPFTDGTLVQRLLAHQTKAPPPIQNRRSDVPESLLDIITKMMEKSKESRYQTAREIENALSNWLVKNGGAEWKQKHPDVVAAIAGVEEVRKRRPRPKQVRRPSDSGELKPRQEQLAAAERPRSRLLEPRAPKAKSQTSRPILSQVSKESAKLGTLWDTLTRDYRPLMIIALFLLGTIIVGGIGIQLMATTDADAPREVDVPGGLE